MAKPAIFWDPTGVELDSVGSKSYLRATDGDTPYVSMSIRMLSIDTPETHYPGSFRPSRSGVKVGTYESNSWIDCHCVHMTTRVEYSPQHYYKVPPCDRIFMWADGAGGAASKMNLSPTG